MPKRVEGWKEIAAVIGVGVHAAIRRAELEVDPLPVRDGHRGPWAFEGALLDWVERQDMAWTAKRRIRRLEAQVAQPDAHDR